MPKEKEKKDKKGSSKDKSKKDKGEKKEKSKGSTEEKAEDATATGSGAVGASSMEVPNLDFEAGRLFERSDRNRTGYIDQTEFQRLWREHRNPDTVPPVNGTAATTTYITQAVPPPPSSLPTPLGPDAREMAVDPNRERTVSYHYVGNARLQRNFTQPPAASELPFPVETIERVKRVNIPVDTVERVERLNVPVERVERVLDGEVRFDGGAYEGSRGGYDYGGEDQTASGFDAGVRFERHDRNGDGYLNRHEFQGLMREWEAEQPDLGLWHSWRRNHSTFDELDRLFDRYDDNRDQHLSRSEFLHLVQELSYGRTAYEATTFRAPVPLRATSPLRSPPRRSEAARDMRHFTWFDETVGLPLTQEGVDSSRRAGHAVTSLQEAYDQRVAKLQEQMTVMLFGRREKLINLAGQVSARRDEAIAARAAVERETTMDCEAILERLRAADRAKQAVLSQHANEVQSEIDVIDRLAHHIDPANHTHLVHGAPYSNGFYHGGKGFSAFTRGLESDPLNVFPGSRYGHAAGTGRERRGKIGAEGPRDMVALIQSYPDLVAAIERTASRPMPLVDPVSGADSWMDMVAVDDFPRELKDRLAAVAKEERYQEALGVKDRMLWEVIQGHKSLEERVVVEQELCKEYSEEMNAWLELTDKLSREVNDLRQFKIRAMAMEDQLRILDEENQSLKAQASTLYSQNQGLLEENMALNAHLRHHGLDPGFGMNSRRPGSTQPPPESASVSAPHAEVGEEKGE